MKSRTIIPLVVGLAIGVLAIKSFVSILQKARGEGLGEMVEVVRAKVDIGAAVQIDDTMVEVAEIPKSLAPKLSFGQVDEIVGRVTTQVIPSGTAVVPSFLAPEGTPPGMAARIPDGYRAVAIRVDEIVGVAGWLKPGARVDVLVVMCGKAAGKNGDVCRTVLQDVEVLAVGQEIVSKDPNAAVQRSITVLVDPKEADTLNLASSRGRLKLTMRNQLDREKPETGITTEKDLLISPGRRPQPEEGDPGGSLLARLFSARPEQTDKVPSKIPAIQPAPVPPVVVMAPEPPQERWVVQVLSGGEAGEIAFESDAKDARRVDGGPSKGTSPARRSSVGAASPVSRIEAARRQGLIPPAVGGASPGSGLINLSPDKDEGAAE